MSREMPQTVDPVVNQLEQTSEPTFVDLAEGFPNKDEDTAPVPENVGEEYKPNLFEGEKLKEIQQLVKENKFMRAQIEGIFYYQSHPEEAHRSYNEMSGEQRVVVDNEFSAQLKEISAKKFEIEEKLRAEGLNISQMVGMAEIEKK